MKTLIVAAVACSTLLAVASTARALIELHLPADIRAEAEGPAGAVVRFEVSATNPRGKSLPVSCTRESGSLFPLGTTVVECAVVDDDVDGTSTAGSFSVTVVDTTPPQVAAPPELRVASASTTGIPATDPAIAAFLAAATASDLVTATLVVTTNAPAIFPVGTTRVTFTATDAAGNRSEASSAVVVTGPTGPAAPSTPAPGPPSPPAPPPPPGGSQDRTPPADVADVKVRASSRLVVLSWVLPRDADLSKVVIRRTLAGTPGNTVYEGRARSFVDRDVRNGVSYRYLLVTYDQAGNRSTGVAVDARPTAPRLVAPPDSARVRRPPVLAWRAVAGATYYNVQVHRNGKKVLSLWPTRARLPLRARWTFRGRRHALTAGTYTWYVWPAFGSRREARYGAALGASRFVYAARNR